MTRLEAIAAMREGKKVTHDYFTPSEFICIELGKIVDEKGYILADFWKYRQAASSSYPTFHSSACPFHRVGQGYFCAT